MSAPKFGMGQAVTRVEDARLITGRGRYSSDIVPAGAAVGFVLRSPFAHARIRRLDATPAKSMPGVLLVLTAADVAHLGSVPCQALLKTASGATMKPPVWPVLCGETVQHVGDGVAFIVAETLDQAKDAAEAIVADYDTLPVVTDIAEALAPGAPQVWPQAPGNIAYEQSMGDKEAVDAIFAGAARVVSLPVTNNRVVANYMETRACFAEYDAAADKYTLTMGSQGVHGMRDILTEQMLKIEPEQLRVITPDVGGGFGTKNMMYREYALVLDAAKRLGRPVAWVQERTEHFLACAQGRDNLSVGELALDEAGRFLAMRVSIDGNLGAYCSQYGPYIHWLGGTMATGCYDIPAFYLRVRGIYTHTVPVDAYRGAGRPEAAYLLERLVDVAARELKMEPEALRALNFIKPKAMPYRTKTQRTYDVGDFEGAMRAALEKADQAGFARRRVESAARGKVRGFGFASYIECTAWGSGEEAVLKLRQDGDFELLIGTQSNGQGHETAYAQAAAGVFDIPAERIMVVQGDTDRIATGHGTGGSRSIPVGFVSATRASEALAAQLKELAADRLETAISDLEITNGMIGVAGTDRRIALADIAALPAATPEKLTASNEFVPPEATYPNGTHVAEVEIDPATGAVSVVRYTIVDDFGATVNPLLLAGQVHGGIVQGIGQALMEHTVYDSTGQLLSASFMDYAVPRADNAPSMDFSTRNVPSTTNPLGIKGAGEAGSIGSCPAVMNAVVDALHDGYGIRHIDMPATPQKVWAAIASAQAAA
jgi:carbon-monoxide dehydrogenase large subunit